MPHLLYIQIYQYYLGCHFEVKLLSQKCAWAGVSHTSHLFANANDPHICPMNALLQLAALYGKANPCTGPLFLKVNSSGGVMFDQPIVCITNILVCFFIILISFHILVLELEGYWPRTCKQWDTTVGHSMEPTHFVMVAANTSWSIADGLLVCFQPGMGGHRWKQ